MIKSIRETLDIAKVNNFESINIFKNGIISNLILFTIIYISAITLIAPICIFAISVIKGFSIGIYISTIFAVFGFAKGLLVVFLIVILPNLIYLPSYIFLVNNAIKFHYDMFESESKISIVMKEVYKIIISFSLIIFSILIEQLASFAVINIYLGT